ncbi:LytTR family DNA-binding domain-containing protein [Sulfitobacter sp. F26169L]|uniref:LytTR family DNA-binding domain-containing protein n=1 Tax=Sulfitobacter sp. F26169L TaxID=2996015 RepID=UPI0022609612|nr:LytTR family DNA-binding domain-containing protein [Sulfitobacter sp. F26169L]MCX7567584.1 LytTR family DNA-binding domain-containing protein [Sulfitobacter sp. F26169L]
MPLLIWFALSVVAGVAGPFGTLEALGLWPRLLYWCGIVGGSIALCLTAISFARGYRLKGAVAVWTCFVLSLCVYVINMFIFAGWAGVPNAVSLLANVALVTAAVHLVIWAVGFGENDEGAPLVDTFMHRLPLQARAPLVRIEAQDHYLNVVTKRGNELILMRMGDAMTELRGQGVQVHRSHWVSPDAVTGHRREKGRDVLQMSDGSDVPVSRSFRSAVQSAGLF